MEDKVIITDVEELSKVSSEINPIKENKLVKGVILDMKNVIRHNKLLGLAAPQIGCNRRIVVLNFNGDLRAFVDPQIVSCDEMMLNKETCQSIPGKMFIIPRYNKISIRSFTATGKLQDCTLSGIAAYKMQHEIDHLDGVLVSDIGMEIDEDFDKLTESEKEEIIKLYLDAIDEKKAEVEKEINEDEQLKLMKEGIDFVRAVEAGEITITDVAPKDAATEQDQKDE